MKLTDTIGLSMRGGGLKSVAYAGFLQALTESGCIPTAIVGASGGAIVGTSYALGESPQSILEHFQKFRALRLLSPTNLLRRKGIISYDYWLNHAREFSKGRALSEANPKVYVQAVDAETGEVIYFDDGPAAEVVIASSAILPGYTYDGKNYLDGEYGGLYGAGVLRKAGASKVIVVRVAPGRNISTGYRFIEPLRIMQRKLYSLDNDLDPVDHIIDIRIPYSGFSFSGVELEHMFQLGYESGKSFINSL